MSFGLSIRSLLFAPGNDARKLEKALASGADAIVADLEDAVPAGAEKERARELVRELFSSAHAASLLAVRVNSLGTAFWQDDLRMVSELELDALVLPKATPEGVAALGPDGPPVVGIAETAQGLRLAYETACSPRTVALVLGAVDLGAELGLEPRADGLEVLYARSKLVVDSAAAGIRSPFDLVHLNTRDDAGLEAECRLARSLGFRGKACIHPAQVEIVNSVFSPSEEEAERARRIVRAYERGLQQGRGVVSLDGEMIDLPVVERARQLLAASERSPSDDD
ncbi:MAG TPA: CoA ester lyase [Gaiellaceae bacterium]|nr:CoA ester lyase [Gaiellaceae bacterium]